MNAFRLLQSNCRIPGILVEKKHSGRKRQQLSGFLIGIDRPHQNHLGRSVIARSNRLANLLLLIVGERRLLQFFVNGLSFFCAEAKLLLCKCERRYREAQQETNGSSHGVAPLMA